METLAKSKYINYPNGRSADNFVNPKVEAIYKESTDNIEDFFAKEAADVFWHKKFT